VKAVRELLTHDEPSLRFQALIAFERLGGDAAGEALVRAAGDADLEVRSMAFRLADRRYESSAPPVALVTAARRVLDEPHSAATATAALFLSAHGERAADSALVAVLAAKLPVSDADLQAVMETVAELGIVAAREPLARRAFGAFGVKFGAHGWNACIALSRLGDERASRAILRRLRAWNRDTRTLAVVAAGRARLGAARQAILEFRGDARRADPEAVEEALSMLANVG
jgi:hypothetical protein